MIRYFTLKYHIESTLTFKAKVESSDPGKKRGDFHGPAVPTGPWKRTSTSLRALEGAGDIVPPSLSGFPETVNILPPMIRMPSYTVSGARGSRLRHRRIRSAGRCRRALRNHNGLCHDIGEEFWLVRRVIPLHKVVTGQDAHIDLPCLRCLAESECVVAAIRHEPRHAVWQLIHERPGAGVVAVPADGRDYPDRPPFASFTARGIKFKPPFARPMRRPSSCLPASGSTRFSAYRVRRVDHQSAGRIATGLGESLEHPEQDALPAPSLPSVARRFPQSHLPRPCRRCPGRRIPFSGSKIAFSSAGRGSPRCTLRN